MSGAVRAVVGVVVAVCVVLVATVLVRVLLDDGRDSAVTEALSASADDAVVASDSASTDATEAAERAATEVLGYSWKTLDEDVKAARVLLADELREQYDASMAQAAARVERNRTVVAATPVASSVVAVTDRAAKVLLFVNERTTGTDLDEPRVDLTRLVLVLERSGDRWLVTQIDSL